jgi:hypothetical protein
MSDHDETETETETQPQAQAQDAAEQAPDAPQDGQPAQQQDLPGTEGDMTPRADHGEQSYRGSGRLADKATIVTGGDSGIGKAVALAFAREGADVLISYLDEEEDAQDTRRLVEEAGRRAVLVPGDLADPAHCREAGWTCS